MTFFARPDLSNEQFKQLEGSVLTLTGTTQIAAISGFSLTNGAGTFIPVTAEGAASGVTDFWSLAYDPIKNEINLQDISGGVGVYLGASPTTCTVGGLSANTKIFGTGFTCILEMILVPTVNPTVVGPSQTFNLTPSTSTFEVGESFNVSGVTAFNRGSVSPVYDSSGNLVSSSGPRSGIPFQYVYGGNLQTQSVLPSIFNFTGNTRNHSLSNVYIDLGNNNWNSCVRYYSGSTVFNSSGGVFLTGLTSGFTQSNINFSGIYPYYWGRWRTTTETPAGVNRPTIEQIRSCINQLNLLRATSQPNLTVWNSDGNSTNIVVAPSTGTIVINFNSSSVDYVWFAIQDINPLKTSWFITETNRGIIGGAIAPGGNLFPSPIEIINAESMKWGLAPSVGNQTIYKLYLSNYQSRLELPMQIRN